MRAFVVGNAAWDTTLRLAALPRPGASVHVARGSEGPGGKGLNQAVALARAGVPTTLVAAIGRDAAGDRIAAALAREGLAAGLIRRDLPTDWSAVLLAADGENAVLTARDAALALDAATVEAALAPAAPGDLVVLQGNLAPEATAATMRAARARGMTTAFNPSPFDAAFAPMLATDLLFLNRDEAVAAAGSAEPDALRQLGAGRTIVTLGADGALLVTAGDARRTPAAPAALVDPTGAGDVMMATALAHAASRGWRVDAAALAAGAAAAALCVGRAGAFAALPTRDELAAIIARP